MIARIIIAITAVACVVMTVSASDRVVPPVTAAIPAVTASVSAGSPSKAPPLAATPSTPPVVAQSATCAADCQAQHDHCRIRTKGSSSCDGEREQCLQKCLQKKAR